MEKEKELAIAVAKVESLTQQLDKQRKGWSQSSPSREKTHQELELERLRKELMVRMRDITLYNLWRKYCVTPLFIYLQFVIKHRFAKKASHLGKLKENGKNRKNFLNFFPSSFFSYFRRGMNLTTSRAFRSSHRNNFSLKNTKNCLNSMLRSIDTPTTWGKNDHRTTTSTHQTLA